MSMQKNVKTLVCIATKQGSVDTPVRIFTSIDSEAVKISKKRLGLPAFLSLRWFGVPDLEIVKEAILAHAAEFHLRLRRVSDAGGLHKGDGLAIDGGAHGITDGF